MSGIGNYPVGSDTTPPYTTYGLLLAQSTQVQTRLDTLTEQYSTGLVATTFSGLGASAQTALNLNAEVTQQATLITGIGAADATLSLTQSVLQQIGSIASTFRSQAETLNSEEPANVDEVAASARDALQQVAALLNTQNDGQYLFAGPDEAVAPVPSGDAILSGGFYTQISAAVQGLATNGASATIASTLAIASSNAAGTSPFSAYLSQPASSLRPSLSTVAIGDGHSVTIGVAASANTEAVSAGTSTTGSYVRDLLRSLATLGSLDSGQATDPGFSPLVIDTLGSLGSAVDGVADEQGVLGDRQQQIDGASTLLSSANTALTSQISDIQNVDLATVSTQLSQTQAQLQASYKMIATTGSLSLLNYLSTTG